MTGGVRAAGSIRRRLSLQLLSGAALLTLILVFIVRSFAQQLAEQSQDNILTASVTSILDASAIQQGELTVDIPYSAFSMLSNISDDRVFYSIVQDGSFLTGYEDLPAPATTGTAGAMSFVTALYRAQEVRMVTATRRLALGDQPIDLRVSVAQTRNGQAQTLAQISQMALLFGSGFFAVAAVLALARLGAAIDALDDEGNGVKKLAPKLWPVCVSIKQGDVE